MNDNTTNNSNNIIYCNRCGAEMKANSRYCMKCGNLNYDNAANQGMMKYAQTQTNTYQIGSGVAVKTEQKAGDVIVNSKFGSKVACYLFNLILFFLVMIVETLLVYSYVGSFDNKMLTLWATVSFAISFSFMMMLSLQIVFMKANKPWWYVFIPVLNYFTYFKIACEKWLPGLYVIIISFLVSILMGFNRFTGIIALVISILLIFYLFKIQGSFAKKYSHSSVLYILFPFIMLPVIAFDGCVYKGIIYSDKNLTPEKDYKFKRFILSCFLLVIFVGLGLTLYFRKDDFATYRDNLEKRYYVYAANKVYYEARSRFSNSQLSCYKVNFNSENGTYYIYYPDVGRKIFLIFSKMRESISATVKIVAENGEVKYYISLSDGVYGFDETLYEDININTITYKRDLDFIPTDYDNYCDINYGETKEA